MKENNQLIISIVRVVAIVSAVVGATYAYWQWQTGTNEQTSVTFTVLNNTEMLSASLDGGTLTVSKLAPVTSCTNSTYATKANATLTYTNNSGSPARATGTLTVTTFTVKSGRDAFQTNDLTHLHYALTTSSSSCSTGVIASGTFEGKNSNGSVLINNVVLQDNIASGTTNGTKPMYLYVWLDKDYTFTNVGSGAVQDPMEDLTIVLTWTGQITNNLS